MQTTKIISLILLTLLLEACSISRMLPKGPVISSEKRKEIENRKKISPANYLTEAKVTYPILPFLAFGVAYDIDLVIVSNHPEWNMHEFACIKSPKGNLWLAKDAREGSLDQYITTNISDPYRLLPELPLKIKTSPVTVVDKSTDNFIDIAISYKNHDGEITMATYKGVYPSTEMGKRNGSTMGHSKNQLLAVIDVSKRDFGTEATISYNGKEYGVSKILGIKSFFMALVQTQGGLSTGSFLQKSLPKGQSGFITNHLIPDKSVVTQKWVLENLKNEVRAIQKNYLRTIEYRFFNNSGSFELYSIKVLQLGRKAPCTNIFFNPPLPDFRKEFSQKTVSTYLIDINGEKNFAIGRIESRNRGEITTINVIPEKPWWTEDRPLQSTIEIENNGRTNISVVRK